MIKLLGGLMAGIFLGALTVEIMRRLKPKLLTDVENNAKSAKQSFVEAFRSGYRE